MFGNLSSFENDLFGQLERMRREMDALFSGRPGPSGIRSVASGTYPAINVGAGPERVDIYLFVAGIDPKGLDISLQQNLLSIAGTRRAEAPDQVQYYRRERFTGDFRRVISLPEDVDPDKVNARYRDGVLHITVERREEVRPRQIEVR
ncbi:molecular chaperone (small heat shock protein) [Thioflavicoccus mobilis 8321]|uniref:Molecular chaperone (Small heat shock protein) n=1 Tax=Thioflavicoccus mobilis 8321 TaxID=765912 RepID=L0GZT2_9GAMM|nr:Hsp20/alpha crystallin family protein [Thioflavicoccus mobilis]AGA92273.1 molecular chaperone (small heat shock protein) [Thioflavicoccus mobilis 8321]